MEELENPRNKLARRNSESDLGYPNNGESFNSERFIDQDCIDSNCSTPYVSAPSSPGRSPSPSPSPTGYYFSAPSSPMHYVLSSKLSSSSSDLSGSGGSFEFDFSGRFSSNNAVGALGSMISADELFLNGQIRPMKQSSTHLQRSQTTLVPLLDDDDVAINGNEEEKRTMSCSIDFDYRKREEVLVRGRDLRLRNRSLHRRTRSMSPLPLRNPSFQWRKKKDHQSEKPGKENDLNNNEELIMKQGENPLTDGVPLDSGSCLRSSSSGRSSKRWDFLKDFLRSKSEGRGNGKEKFWHSMTTNANKEKKKPSFSTREKKKSTPPSDQKNPKQQVVSDRKTPNVASNGVGKRRRRHQSAHELHYTANRAQSEEMKKKTYLPYRQGLFGCLGFSSKSYVTINGFTRALNPVSSR